MCVTVCGIYLHVCRLHISCLRIFVPVLMSVRHTSPQQPLSQHSISPTTTTITTTHTPLPLIVSARGAVCSTQRDRDTDCEWSGRLDT